MSTKSLEATAVPAEKKKATDTGRNNNSGEKKGKPNKIQELVNYFTVSRAELRKVSWPTFKETKATSLVVFGFVAIMAIVFGLVDLGLSSLISFILSV